MLEQYNLELISLDERIEKLKNELRPLQKRKTQLQKNITLYEWRKKKSKK